MRRQQIDTTVQTAAPPEVVYAMLRNRSTWPTSSPFGAFERERALGRFIEQRARGLATYAASQRERL